MSVFHLVGLTGFGLYLFAYALLQFGVLRGSGYAYTLLNISAAGCVLFSLAESFNLSSFLIQVSWISISLVGLTRTYLHHKSLRFSEAEMEMAKSVLPGLPRAELRRLLNRGRWEVQYSDTVLSRQGEPVDELIFVLSGEADVIRNGAKIATVYAGSFVGEMTCLTGAPATATVVVRSRMHCFTIETAALREHVRTRPEALEHLERSFSADLRRKLQLASDKLVDLTAGDRAAGSRQIA